MGLWVLLFVFSTATSALGGTKTAVLGIHAAPIDRAQASRLTPMLRDAFRDTRGFSSLVEEDARRALATRREDLHQQTFYMAANALLKDARAFALQARFEEALESASQAEAILYYFREQLTSNQVLWSIQELKAQLYYGLGHPNDAEPALRTMAQMAPGRALDPARFSQEIIAHHQRMLDDTRSSARLRITSIPEGASVFLDGNLRGTTPLTLPNLPRGYHFLRMARNDGGVHFEDLEIPARGDVVVRSQLRPPRLGRAGVISRLTAPDESMTLMAYQAMGRVLGLDVLPIAWLHEGGLELQLFQLATGQVSTSFQAPVGEDVPNLETVIHRLVGQVTTLLNDEGNLRRTATLMPGVTLGNNPELPNYYFAPLGSDAIAWQVDQASERAARRAKPFYKRRWFWAIVGGSAAATAGGIAWWTLGPPSNVDDQAGISFQFPNR